MADSGGEKVRRFGRFEILSRLGHGGMAEVFRARVIEGPGTGWEVALKRLLPALAKEPSYRALFASEADLSRQLKHPNIVQVLEVGELSGIEYIVMELIDGRDLGQILRRCKQRNIPLPIDFALYLGKVLFDSLAYAHSALNERGEPLGVVHCDVSPSNVFISRVGEIKLGDFGIARGRGEKAADSGLLGKPYYTSPEALSGKISPDLDLWSGAVTLYELCTLERPFTGTNPNEVFEAIRARKFPPVRKLRPEAPAAIDAIIARAFAVDASRRYTSAADIASALTPLYNEHIGTPLAIAAVVRGLFGAGAGA